ncbi:zinc-ribbon domain-containing protein [Candidatus Jordarchaeum sp.]|uniref:zinc-ribbon domain-containing protein n=1 Tax=Candidatus Jordarchaeum sp. TaxID=2823881 RepID=UPI00404A8F87
MAREIYGSIPREGHRISDFAEILNEELNSSRIRVKRKSQFEWKLSKGINAKGILRLYRSGSNIVYEGKVGYNYIPLALSLVATAALIIISLFFIHYGILFAIFFLFIFLKLSDIDNLEHEVRTAILHAVNKYSPQPTDLSPREVKDEHIESEFGPDRYCMYCGCPITPDAMYCPKCGNRIRY